MRPMEALDAVQAEEVRSLAREACTDMFRQFGAPLTALGQLPAAGLAHEIAASVGFTGAVRGSLLVASSSRFFHDSYPPGLVKPPYSSDVLLDWAGELANQILGRMKRRFCARGTSFDVSPPRPINGSTFQRLAAAEQGVWNLLFRVRTEIVSVSLEMNTASGRRIFEDGVSGIECQTEGDCLEF
jgi:chemotaxis protein CheX